jgi:Transposase DDE domain
VASILALTFALSFIRSLYNYNTGMSIKLVKRMKDCQVCPSRTLCTRAARSPRCTIMVRREPHYQALQQARERATTEEFKSLYTRRAGVEGTISEASACARSAEIPSPASCHSSCHERDSSGALARWCAPCSNQTFGFGSAALSDWLNVRSRGSPAVSKVRVSRKWDEKLL